MGLSSSLFWGCALAAALADSAFIALLNWRVGAQRFRELRWLLAIAAALFWGVFGLTLVQIFWESYYRFFYPTDFNPAIFLALICGLYGAFALLFHWLALRLPGNPLLTFCLLTGVESLLEHLWGFYGLKVLEVPMLRAASPISILAFAFPEYIFYWCVIISLAALMHGGWRQWKNRKV